MKKVVKLGMMINRRITERMRIEEKRRYVIGISRKKAAYDIRKKIKTDQNDRIRNNY